MAAASQANASALPVGIPPSEYWDGVMGKWSTFWVQVGSPPQALRLFPGTSSAGSAPWVIFPQGCTAANPNVSLSICSQSRGGIFLANESTSWTTQGLDNTANGAFYALNTVEETLLGLVGGGGSFGYDTISFGLDRSQSAVVNHQLLAGIAADEFWLGSLGINPLPSDLGSLDNQIPSLLTNLKTEGAIPSASWGYTAGAYYQDPPVFGSLTLGGYDSSRFVPNNRTFAMGADITRDLLINLQSITYSTGGSQPLLASGIDVFIDSLITELWLPVDVCQAFERQFNLTWESNEEIYLVSDDAHRALLAENPTFSFTFSQAGVNNSSAPTVVIDVPYAAFDINITQPLVKENARYFPLKQAQNRTQYTLGRTMLQDMYVIADYERRNFSLSQAQFPPTSQPAELVAIRPVGSTTSKPSSGSGFGTGAIAGTAVGCVALITILVLGAYFWYRRRRRTRSRLQARVISAPTMLHASSLSGADNFAPDFNPRPVYSPPPQYRDEHTTHEVDAVEQQMTEMDANDKKHALPVPARLTHELAGVDPIAYELESPQDARHELQARWHSDIKK